ncbi:hypothetical protein EMIT0111MI5_40012 [Burkholderia sp. IT-111MI5]
MRDDAYATQCRYRRGRGRRARLPDHGRPGRHGCRRGGRRPGRRRRTLIEAGAPERRPVVMPSRARHDPLHILPVFLTGSIRERRVCDTSSTSQNHTIRRRILS